MASLEEMNKKDLVSIARKLDQENKELRGKLEKVGVSGEELPHNALSIVKRDDGGFTFVKLKFDLDSGVASVTERVEFEKGMQHMAEYRAKEFFAQIARLDHRRS